MGSNGYFMYLLSKLEYKPDKANCFICITIRDYAFTKKSNCNIFIQIMNIYVNQIINLSLNYPIIPNCPSSKMMFVPL